MVLIALEIQINNFCRKKAVMSR